ncbi:hypothetical protein K402DRAFT_423655, partial [Aulographum hederae CBS 113979]
MSILHRTADFSNEPPPWQQTKSKAPEPHRQSRNPHPTTSTSNSVLFGLGSNHKYLNVTTITIGSNNQSPTNHPHYINESTLQITHTPRESQNFHLHQIPPPKMSTYPSSEPPLSTLANLPIIGSSLCRSITYTITLPPSYFTSLPTSRSPPSSTLLSKNATCSCTACRKFTGALQPQGLTVPTSYIRPPLLSNSDYMLYRSGEGTKGRGSYRG